MRNEDGLFVFFSRFQTKRAQRRTLCVAEGNYSGRCLTNPLSRVNIITFFHKLIMLRNIAYIFARTFLNTDACYCLLCLKSSSQMYHSVPHKLRFLKNILFYLNVECFVSYILLFVAKKTQPVTKKNRCISRKTGRHLLKLFFWI